MSWRKHDPYTCCLEETHLRKKDLHGLKENGWKKIFQANGQEEKARVAILTSKKTDYKTKAIKRQQKDTSQYSGEHSIKKT